MSSPTDPGTVIFRPLLDRMRVSGIAQLYLSLAMTDFGDHVEWFDRKRTTRMRLPDQPDTGAAAGDPMLHTVLIAEFRMATSPDGKILTYRIRFLDPQGSVIAWLGPHENNMPNAVPYLFPEPEAYAQLIERGVQLRHARYTSNQAFRDDFPDERNVKTVPFWKRWSRS